MYQSILFDLDGTLIESGPGILNSLRYTLDRMGFPPLPDETLRKFVGPPLTESMMRFCGMTEEEAAKAIACYRTYYAKSGIYEAELYPGIAELLDALRASGKTLAVATSKPEPYARRILAHFGIAPYFSAVCGASMDEKHVGKAAIIGCALAQLGIPQEQKQSVLMVGDREHDVLGAKENGIACLGVLFGYGSRAELLGAGADGVVETAKEALEWISHVR